MADQYTAAFRLRTSRSDPPPGFVERQRLNSMLNHGARRAVTIVCAGPGYGKTLAVSAWVGRGDPPGPVAWLTADTRYDVQGLWADLLDALRISGVVPQSSVLATLTPGVQFGEPEFDRIVEGLMRLPTPIVVVLDDFHHITDPAALDSLNRVAEYRIPQLRLVLVSRTEPELRLSRLRLVDDVADIDGNDLTYTAAETREVCARSGVTVVDGAATELHSRTQGWPAGLRLAMISVDEAAGAVPALEHFSGNNRRVAEYLLEEILDRLSPSDRLFLLATSVVDQMTAELARALSGRVDSRQVLEDLVARNALTVRLSDRPNWFRYHPLLRELLLDRLSAENPDSVPELNRRAADWYVGRNEPIDALRHYAYARDWSTVARVLGQVALPLILTPQAAALVSALSTVYDDVARLPTAETLIVALVCDYQRHDFESMQRNADEATLLLNGTADPLTDVYRVIIAIAHTVHARASVPSQLVDTADALLELLDHVPRREVPASAAYAVVGINNRATGLVHEGHLDEAQVALSAVRTQGEHLGLGLTVLSAASYLSLVEFLLGDLDQAETESTSSLAAAERRGWAREPQLLAAYAAAALVYLDRGEREKAERYIDAGLVASTKGSDFGCRLLLHVAAVGVAVARQEASTARTALHRLDLSAASTSLPALLVAWSRVCRAEVAMAVGEPHIALDVIGDLGDPGDPVEDVGYVSSLMRITRAKALLELARPAAALEELRPAGRFAGFRALAAEGALLEAAAQGHLRRDNIAVERIGAAVALSAPIGLRRPFLRQDAQIPIQLNRYIRLSGDRSSFVTELAGTFGVVTELTTPPATVLQSLTERELAVLKYLPTMLKSSEIAADLFVSVNTVKTHQRSIYRKLGVSNRREAVESARYWEML
ncbi:LuxR C-terminal-related transcriptional regulator [Williamsia sp. 1135]|uniref:LuxR C-terminal-related transcriptional regulator n=1 Tax=Williamsia sp. 1135 TaxID=1889262 RepID=UPI00143A4509|nr:LuxR C-terminal-related transcriptional regulator [Williamsia sp. 1135]